MTSGGMHADEVLTDESLVRRLLEGQFPEWAELPIRRVESAGTDNALYRLGSDMVVRLPRIHWATEQVEKEQRWLPTLAPQLPLRIPAPLAKGAPAEGYPWQWSVYGWIEGENVDFSRMADPRQTAAELARFVSALQRIAAAGGPPAGAHNFYRGVPLARRDSGTREALAELGDRVDVAAATAAWDEALQQPEWSGPPVWIHGDLQSGNLLTVEGRLCAVIDFGGLGLGDPACDMIVAWNLFSTDTREAYRAALGVDDSTWARGRGWALSVSLIGLPYYWDTNPAFVRGALRTVAEVLDDIETPR